MNPLTTLVAKELRVELRSLQGTVGAAMVALFVLLALRLTLTNDEVDAGRLAPGILWTATLFAGVALLNHTTQRDAARGTREVLRLTPLPRSTLYLGQALANLVMLWGLQLAIFIIYILLFGNAFGANWPLALAAMLLGGAGFAAVGTLTAQATAALPGAWTAATLLTIPLVLFTVVEASLTVVRELLVGGEFATALGLLLLYDAAFLAGGAWLSELAD